MVQESAETRPEHLGADATATISLGKGAWDCDKGVAIPPEKEAEVFEETVSMDYLFEGIPTVPPRKDMDHMVFFCSGCRVTAYREWTAAQVKQALWDGGIRRSNKPKAVRNTPGLQQWQDLTLVYAGQHMADDKQLKDYHVPAGCQTLIAIETAKLSTKPDCESAYWN